MNRKMRILTAISILAILFSNLPAAAPVQAALITPVSKDAAGATILAQAMLADLTTLVSAEFVTVPPFGTPNGVSDSLSFFPTHGSSFGILTSGNVLVADSPNTSPSTSYDNGGPALPGRGNTAFDITILKIDLNTPLQANCLRLDFAFYSEEFPEYVGSIFNDAFIAELDTSTWVAGFTIYAPDNFAFDQDGNVISINSIGYTTMNELNASGTTYDGATVLLQAATPVTSGQHSLYLSIFDQGDHIYDSAVFIDNIRFETVADPTSQCRPGAEVKANVPMVFIPGVGGSKLHNDYGEVWPRVQDIFEDETDEFLYVMRLAPDGVSPYDSSDQAYTTIYPGDVLRQETVEDVIFGFDYTVDFYHTALTTLAENGYEEGVDLFPFPYYDWRKNVDTLAGLLLSYIDEVRANTGAERVDILAHSMGGMVTRAALAQPESIGKVRKVITLGTPILGAPKILGILEYKTPCFTEAPLFGCLTNPDTTQEILTNFPSAYQILPGPNFDIAEAPPLLIDWDKDGDGTDDGPQPYDKWSLIVAANRNAGLMALNLPFHQAYDDLTLADPDVEFYRVLGDGVDSINQIREYISCFLWVFNCRVAYDVVKGNGDGTVPLHSGDVYNPEENFDLRNGIPNAYAHKVNHGELPNNSAVLDFALSFFGTSPGLMSLSTPMMTTSNGERIPEALPPDLPDGMALSSFSTISNNGLSDFPEPLSGIELETLGPLDGYVQDSAGNLLGKPLRHPFSVIYNTVPGANYYSIADTKTFFFNQDGAYMAHLLVTGSEGGRLRVRTYADDKINGQAVFQIGDPPGAHLYLNFTYQQDLAALLLQIDLDGDGTIDIELPPDSVIFGAAADDRLPPLTTLDMHLDSSRLCQVTLTAVDQPGGAGIADSYYILDNLGQPRVYTSPFSFACGKLLRYASIDRAGNMELIQTIQTVPLDITPAEEPNSINLGSMGVVPIAIYSSTGFSVTSVDISTLTFAGAPVARKPNGSWMAHYEYVNNDNMLDLVLHFNTNQLQLEPGSIEALVEGQTTAGINLLGVDWVNIVP